MQGVRLWIRHFTWRCDGGGARAGCSKAAITFQRIVAGMPKGEEQEVRVLTVNFRPGEGTLFRTHRFPVTVYILEGAFRLELEGREPITVKNRPGEDDAAKRENDGLQ